MRMLVWVLAWIAPLVLMPGSSSAADYPNRHINLIVPVPGGGAGDFIARLVAERLSDTLKQTVVVDNRGGASGTIAATLVARSAPDGYTLMLSSSTPQGTAPAAFKQLQYAPISDFTHIGLIATVPAVLSVNAALPVKSIHELVEFAKSRPDQLNYGSSGAGSPLQFWGEMFKSAAGVKMVHVPYKGSGPAMLDLVSGQIQVMLDGLPSQLASIQAGTIRPLAALSVKRSPNLPDVQTMGEAGYPTVLGGLWFGLSGPAGLPKDVVEKLTAAVERMCADPSFASRLQAAGIIVTPLIGADYEKFIADENAKYGQIAREAGITVD